MTDRRRAGRYQRITDQLSDLISESPDLVAAMATICAVLHHKMPHHFWTGFYFVATDDELHIGPY
ncbi:MAG: GAF domain-containing protein, partial [Anaerolineae bacterium]